MAELDRWENERGAVTPAQSTPRLRALKRNHSQLDKQINAECKRPNPCGFELQRLKREKLYVKDQMRKVETYPPAFSNAR